METSMTATIEPAKDTVSPIVQKRLLACQRGQRRDLGNGSARFRIAARQCFSWKETTPETNPEYISVKLNDPSVAATLLTSMARSAPNDRYVLIWSPAAATDPTESNGHALFGTGGRMRGSLTAIFL
jgi:uncharacterized protein (DUF736 family)